MKNSADQGRCYPQRPKAEVDNTLRELQNSSYPTKAEFNNCFIIQSKYFLLLKGVSPLPSLFFCSPNITQPCPQVFSVTGSIIISNTVTQLACLWLHKNVFTLQFSVKLMSAHHNYDYYKAAILTLAALVEETSSLIHTDKRDNN